MQHTEPIKEHKSPPFLLSSFLPGCSDVKVLFCSSGDLWESWEKTLRMAVAVSNVFSPSIDSSKYISLI